MRRLHGDELRAVGNLDAVEETCLEQNQLYLARAEMQQLSVGGELWVEELGTLITSQLQLNYNLIAS